MPDPKMMALLAAVDERQWGPVPVLCAELSAAISQEKKISAADVERVYSIGWSTFQRAPARAKAALEDFNRNVAKAKAKVKWPKSRTGAAGHCNALGKCDD